MSSRVALEVTDLQTHFFTRLGVAKAVDGVSFSVNSGEIMGLVGESGSGKTVTGFSVIGLVDHPGRIVGGQIKVGNSYIHNLDEIQMRSVRGNKVAMIFQDPMMTLNPVLRIDTQMIEAILAHEKISKNAARERSLWALKKVGIPAAKERLNSYPHQLSGGMRQRVAIAIALLNKPDVIIADEPTTALDVTIQAQILKEVKDLAKESGTALVWITHDLSVVAGLADNISVMYAGRIVESGPVNSVLDNPLHPYTKGLLESVPKIGDNRHRLSQIAGMTPSLLNLPSGCPFRPRCWKADDQCIQNPPVTAKKGNRFARCHWPLEENVT